MTRNPFNGLPWQEKLTFGALCLSVAAVVLWWRLGVIAIMLLVVASLVKLISTRRIGNPSLDRLQRICLWAMVAYWILYAVSAIVSTDHAEGWSTAGIKLYFLLLPLLCLCNDTTYLTRHRIRSLFQVLTATLLLRFIVCLAVSGIQYLKGVPLAELKDWQMDPLGLHHNYLALYLVTDLAFLYTQFVERDKSTRQRRLLLLIPAAAALVAYLFMSASRSGILTLGLLAIACLVHLTFVRKRWKTGLCITLFSIGLLAGAYWAVPSTFSRFTTPLQNRDANHVADEREILWECGLKTAKKSLLFGYGSGDYMPPLLESYTQRGYHKAVQETLGTHNQYLETILETGLVGAAMLLFMLFTPFVASLRKNRRTLLVPLAILAMTSQMAFESMLNRQMGAQFIAIVYCLLVLSLASRKEKAIAS